MPETEKPNEAAPIDPVKAAAAAAAAPKPPADDAEKVTLTKAELAAQVAAALDAERKKAEAKAAKEKAAREEQEAKEQGKWEALAKAKESEAATLAGEVRRLKVESALRDHLADAHPDYAKSAKYILPLIPGDVADDALADAVKQAAAEFVRDNPRKAAGSPAAPAGAGRFSPRQPNGEARTPRQIPLASRF